MFEMKARLTIPEEAARLLGAGFLEGLPGGDGIPVVITLADDSDSKRMLAAYVGEGGRLHG
jgi:hypothetical protein